MVYYLGYYSCEQIENEQRTAAPPAMNKMSYVISALSEATEQMVEVVSPSGTRLHKRVKGSRTKINDKAFIKTFLSFKSKNKILRGVGHFVTKASCLLYLLKNVSKNDSLMVYHSLALMKLVKIVKRFKKCNLIIEVEELYSDVKEDEKLRKKELDYLKTADKYIAITSLIDKEVNGEEKPVAIAHGTYRANPKYGDKWGDGKIHVVYAGSFNPVKGGAISAIECAEYLDESYVLDVLGKGTEETTAIVLSKIEEVSKKTKCKISYSGYKSGREFDSFIQSCHIGLSTQQPDGKYNTSSFPSKILMYMSNNVHVVSVRIPAVEQSDVGDCISYYDEQTPQNIANAIKSVTLSQVCDNSKKLKSLNDAFVKQLAKLLS